MRHCYGVDEESEVECMIIVLWGILTVVMGVWCIVELAS